MYLLKYSTDYKLPEGRFQAYSPLDALCLANMRLAHHPSMLNKCLLDKLKNEGKSLVAWVGSCPPWTREDLPFLPRPRMSRLWGRWGWSHSCGWFPIPYNHKFVFWDSHVFCNLHFLTLWLGTCFKETKWFFLDFFFLSVKNFAAGKLSPFVVKRKEIAAAILAGSVLLCSCCHPSAGPTVTVFGLTPIWGEYLGSNHSPLAVRHGWF